MDFKKISIVCVVLFFMASMSGCVNEGTTTGKTFENIDFESDVVKLDNANLAFIKDDEEYGSVRLVELKYFLHNPLDRDVEIVVNIYFYDELNREIYNEIKYPEGYSIPKGYTDGGDTVQYDGNLVSSIDHVLITVYEKTE